MSIIPQLGQRSGLRIFQSSPKIALLIDRKILGEVEMQAESTISPVMRKLKTFLDDRRRKRREGETVACL